VQALVPDFTDHLLEKKAGFDIWNGYAIYKETIVKLKQQTVLTLLYLNSVWGFTNTGGANFRKVKHTYS
jgi:hypothetical protein